MNKIGILGTISGLLAGLIIGFASANYLNKANVTGKATVPNPSMPANPAGGPQNPAGMMEDVQTTIEEAKKNPNDAVAQLRAGDMYAQIGRFDEALTYFENAIKASPDNLEANTGLGKIYFEKKDFGKAGEYFEKAADLDAKNPGLRSDLGLTFYLREPADIKRAVSEYRNALKLDPKHEATLQNLCVALNDLGEKDELAKTVEMLEKVNPSNEAIQKFKVK